MLFNLADFTSDFATPLEAAETVDAGLDRPRLVAAPAAEQLAALDPRRRAVTLAAHRTQRSRVPVGLTVIGGFFRVNQIFPTWWFDGRAFGNDRLSVISWNNFGSAVKFLFQPKGNVAKQGHLPPARTQRTRSR